MTKNKITDDNYYTDREYINASAIKQYLDHPQKYIHYKNNVVPTEETTALLFGSALHEYCLLGEANFRKKYHVMEPGQWQTKAFKEQLKETGQKAIKNEDYARITEMGKVYQAIYQNVYARYKDLNPKEKHEHIITWDQEVNYLDKPMKLVPCKAKIDTLLICENTAVIIDLKSTTDASLYAFKKNIRYGVTKYIIQAVHYMTGIKYNLKVENIICHFIAIEKKTPYANNVFTITDKTQNLQVIHETIQNALLEMTSSDIPKYNDRYPGKDIYYDVIEGDVNDPEEIINL